jgi:3'(2'), 5'-bisphosphate nucleotidase
VPDDMNVDDSIMNKQSIQLLVELVKKVNHLLCEFYQDYQQNQVLQISSKADESPVTEADMAAHHFIEKGLGKINPLIPVLSEESSDHKLRVDWQEFWLVDPLDGTREFINKTGEFTVNIALIRHGMVELSVIGIPTLKRIYLRRKNQPLYRIDEAGETLVWQEIRPQPVNPDNWKIAISRRSEWKVYQQFKQALHDRQQAFDCNNAGSAYKFCLMLEGQIDVYPRFHPTSEWDTAAGQGLLNAIGGGLYDLQGRPFVYNQRHDLLNGHFIAVRHADFLQPALQAANAALKAIS